MWITLKKKSGFRVSAFKGFHGIPPELGVWNETADIKFIVKAPCSKYHGFYIKVWIIWLFITEASPRPFQYRYIKMIPYQYWHSHHKDKTVFVIFIYITRKMVCILNSTSVVTSLLGILFILHYYCPALTCPTCLLTVLLGAYTFYRY